VTVQQPAGWPVWVTTLFSAAVGAVFGFLGTIASERLKKRAKQKKISTHLAAEVLNNLRAMDGVLLMVVPEIPYDTDSWKNYIRAVAWKISVDRYSHYFAQEKEMVYELDEKGMLENFYAGCREIREVTRRNMPEALAESCKNTRGYGIGYLDAREMIYDPNGLPYSEVAANLGSYRKTQAAKA